MAATKPEASKPMSQLDLFGQPVADPEESPKPPAKPRPAPKPKPSPPECPVRVQGPADEPCVRCRERFEHHFAGALLCAACADALVDIQLEDRCIVIGCGCVTMGDEIDGHPICGLHNTDVTRAIMATGAWPAWYGYAGKWIVVATVRRLDDMGHTWAGIAADKHCGACGLPYATWTKDRFTAACTDYAQPDTTKGLFRP